MVDKEQINGYFLEAIRKLKAEGYTQKDIVKAASLSPNAISKIKAGLNNAGDDTINKLCSAFKLNPDFFYRGSQQFTMEEKANLEADRPGMVAEESPKPFIPSWADAFFDIMTQQIKQNEALNRELRQSIVEMNEITKQLAILVKNKGL